MRHHQLNVVPGAPGRQLFDLAATSIDHSQSAAALPVKLIPVAKWSATALNHQCLFPELLLKLPCCRQGWQGKDILV